MVTRRSVLKAGVAATLGIHHGLVTANTPSWPDHEIRVILPVAPGGANDSIARAVFDHASAALGVPFVIMNMPGGNATRGTIALANSKNDGYTIGNVAYSALLLQPHMVEVPYKLSDFDMIGAAGEPLYALAVAANSPIQTIDDLVALAKKRRVTVASNTIINVTCMIELKTMTGGNFEWVPTSSQGQAIVLVGGEFADCALQSAPEINAGIASGKIRMIASANTTRWPNQPGIKTFIEQGYDTAVSVPLGYGAPAGLDPVIRDQLERAVLNAARSPKISGSMTALGVLSRPLDGQGLREAFRVAAPKLEKILADAGMKKY